MTGDRNHRKTVRMGLVATLALVAWMVPVIGMAGGIGTIPVPTIPTLPNMIGLGIGLTPDYPGANSRSIAEAPIFRYQFQGSERYIYLIGPLATFNLVNDRAWHAGPLLSYRPGREDADDAVVRKLHEISATVEAGAFVSHRWVGTGAVPWEVQVSVSALQGFTSDDGAHAWLGAHVLAPVSHWAVLGFGGSINFTDAKTMNGYYGITRTDSTQTGLPMYQPGGGNVSDDLWMSVAFLIHPRWAIGSAIYWQRLRGNAADSPWVSTQGNVNQVTLGVGLIYYWE